MQILAICPGCNAGLPVPAVDAADAVLAIRCGRCGRDLALAISDELRADRTVDICPVCRGAAFYLRKDFDPKIGLTVVAIGGLTSAGFYWFGRDLVAYGILAAAVIGDLVVYGLLKDVTVCYRCHSEFRGAYRRTATAFDLHTADVLEREYERKTGRR
jgi:hypothetical protein